jgi:Protein of unknown function (DUF3311)
VPWILLVPFIGTLWVPLYARVEPTLWGVPFFYWYQIMWVPLTSLIVGIVYWAERRGEP